MAGKNGEMVKDSNLKILSCNISHVDIIDSEILGSSDSLSLPSEPPDIRNWFSSYMYQSPDSGIGDDFDSFLCQESEIDKVGFSYEKINTEEEQNLRGFKCTRNRETSVLGKRETFDGLVDCHKFVGDDDKQKNQPSNKDEHSVESIENLPTSNYLFLRNNDEDESLEDRLVQKHDLVTVKGNENSSLNNGDCLQNQERRFSKEGNTNSSINKENERQDLVETGFISTRRNRNYRENDGNIPKRRSREVHAENLRNAERDSGVGRSALVDKTNFQYGVMQEIAGKWCCPQKSKPNLGPPLKQLRLERWIHRA